MKKKQKRGTRRIQVEADQEFLQYLVTYQGDIFKNQAIRLGAGPAVRKAAIEFWRARYPEIAKRATA